MHFLNASVTKDREHHNKALEVNWPLYRDRGLYVYFQLYYQGGGQSSKLALKGNK